MNAVECLVAARKKIEDPANWGKGKQANHRKVLCAITAIGHARAEAFGTDFWRAEWALREVIGRGSIVMWNDAPERTHAEVLAAFDKAIELANV